MISTMYSGQNFRCLSLSLSGVLSTLFLLPSAFAMEATTCCILVDGRIVLGTTLGLTDEESRTIKSRLTRVCDIPCRYRRAEGKCFHSNPDTFIERLKTDPKRAIMKGKIRICAAGLSIDVDSLKLVRPEAAIWGDEAAKAEWKIDPSEIEQLGKIVKDLRDMDSKEPCGCCSKQNLLNDR